MKRRNIGTGILLVLLITSLMPLAGVYALPSPPTDEAFKLEAIDYMLANHPELVEVDSDDWEFSMVGFTATRFKLKFTYAEGPDVPPTYDLDWVGVITWNAYSDEVHVTELYYSYEVDLTVEKVGPGTIDPSPGVYTVDGGDSYSFTASAARSEFPEEYFFKFVKWTIDDGESVTESFDTTLSGVASTDLTITAIFAMRSMSHCRIVFEDGLEAGYMWRDDHVLLVVRPVMLSEVTVTVLSDYGEYSETFMTGAKSFCIYFSAERFVGEYIVYVSATNDLGSYMPKTLVAGVD